MSSPPGTTRSNTVGRITDKKWLEHVALNIEEPKDDRRMVHRLRGTNHLTTVAQKAHSYVIRRETVELIKDDSILSSVALEDPHWKVRLAALKRLSNESVLRHAALHGKHHWERYVATSRSNNLNLMAKFHDKSSGEYIIAELKRALLESYISSAVFSLELLQQRKNYIGLNSGAILYGEHITFAIMDSSRFTKHEEYFTTKFPYQVAGSDKHDEESPAGVYEHPIRRARIDRYKIYDLFTEFLKKYSDKNQRQKWAQSATTPLLRAAALRTITEVPQAGIPIQHEDELVRNAAIEKASDQAALATVAQHDSSEKNRADAIKKLSNRMVLEEISKKNKSPWGIGFNARERLKELDKLTP